MPHIYLLDVTLSSGLIGGILVIILIGGRIMYKKVFYSYKEVNEIIKDFPDGISGTRYFTKN